MSNILTRETNTITVANFWENHLLDKYDFEPAYQRKSVWSEEKQSFFIDSLMKNFPMPPIFMRQKIDDNTGKTTYDIIDGKQRLTSILRFLKNEIVVSNEFEESPFYDSNISGVYFQDLDSPHLSEYKKRFWRYPIPIEYIDTTIEGVIDNIFDRLNRNGEPLTGQELRKSSYHGSDLLKWIEATEHNPFWNVRLQTTDVTRMEHYEFISEILFQLIEGKPLHATQTVLDDLYRQYAIAGLDWADYDSKFQQITDYMSGLSIDYDVMKVGGVSHLYGLWCLCHFCVGNNIDHSLVKSKMAEFYKKLRSGDETDERINIYKKSMASRTKDKSQRKRRFDALVEYCLGGSASQASSPISAP
jgi:hypothetical protein